MGHRNCVRYGRLCGLYTVDCPDHRAPSESQWSGTVRDRSQAPNQQVSNTHLLSGSQDRLGARRTGAVHDHDWRVSSWLPQALFFV